MRDQLNNEMVVTEEINIAILRTELATVELFDE